jgi:hypothetical protein
LPLGDAASCAMALKAANNAKHTDKINLFISLLVIELSYRKNMFVPKMYLHYPSHILFAKIK